MRSHFSEALCKFALAFDHSSRLQGTESVTVRGTESVAVGVAERVTDPG
jgi:hypothetical protein